MKLIFAGLKIGDTLTNKRNSKSFKVETVLPEEGKVELLNLDTQDFVTVSKATLERWYEVQNETHEPKGPKVARRSVRRTPRPVVTEPIASTNDTEVVEIKEKRNKKANSAVPKSDHVLSLTKELEARISKDFPASRRGVTQSFIKYHHKYNFVKIFQTKSKIRINVLSRAMPEEVKQKLDRIVPAKYGWPIDGLFTIRREEDLDTAMELIAYSAKGAKD
jgi:hypothetical protein|nr:MAG TPA: hypothetical protein [Caudoviricetes sp.]